MIIAIDFDGTLVSDAHAYDDLTTPLEFLPGAREGVLALKAAGHTLILWSGRGSAVMYESTDGDPWVRLGIKPSGPGVDWKANRALNLRRFAQMRDFVNRELSGVFAHIDIGDGGKPPAHLFIDDRSIRAAARVGGPDGLGGQTWPEIAAVYGAG